jgi:aryl-alcohol dehydrogenase-like predicted oxidoreductase
MNYRKIETLKMTVPLITFGGASLSGEGGGYGFGQMNEKEAESLILSAWEQGITLYDTAPIYGFGLSEERLGKYLPRKAMVISKSGVDWHESKRVNMTNSREVTEKMLEESLKRLKRDVIDIYMIHWPDARVDIRIPLEVLKRAQQSGKIKHIGLCNTNLEDLEKAKEICQVDVLQSELNLFNQEAFLRLKDEWTDQMTMGWGTFDKGILSGRVTHDRKFSQDDCRSWAPWWNKKEVREKIERTQKLREILSDYNLSLQSFCLHYSVNYFGLSTCLIGFKTVEDIAQVTSSLQSIPMRERIEEVLDRWLHQD